VTQDPTIRPGGLDDPRVLNLLRFHVTRALEVSGIESTHALAADALEGPGISFWTAWADGVPLGFGALKELTPDHGEVKSMHVAEQSRGKGVARAIVRHIIAAAKERGYTRLSLETGSMDYFAPARALYRSHGFTECAPFANYRPDPKSTFMTMSL